MTKRILLVKQLGIVILTWLLSCTYQFAFAKPVIETELASLVWQNRVVIGNPKSQHSQQALIELLETFEAQVDARKLIFILPVKDKWLGFPKKQLSFSSQSIEAKLASPSAKEYILIGLDGGVKQRFNATEFDLEQIFNLIDIMPMRRQELESLAQ